MNGYTVVYAALLLPAGPLSTGRSTGQPLATRRTVRVSLDGR